MFFIGFTKEPLEYPFDDTSIPAAQADWNSENRLRTFWPTFLYGENQTTSPIGHAS